MIYMKADATQPIGFWSHTTGYACYAGYLEEESNAAEYAKWFVYVFDGVGTPIAWARVQSIDDLTDLVERGCTYRFDYLYGDAEAFGYTVDDLRFTEKYDEIDDPETDFYDAARKLEEDQELYWDEDRLAIADGNWVVENVFPDPAGWLDSEYAARIEEEVSGWPEWKKQAYLNM